MAHSKQAKKRVRQNEKSKQENKATRGAMRTAEKKVRRAETSDDANAALPKAQSRIDKSAKKGVLHRNAAARRKSRLAKAANKVGAK